MVSVLNDAARTLEDLRAELPSVVDETAAPLRKRRDATRDAQNSLWGQAKAPQVATRGRRSRRRTERRKPSNRPPPDSCPVFWSHYTAVVNKVALNELPEARRRRYLRAGVAFTLDADGTLIATWAVGSPVANGWRTHGNEHWEFDASGLMRRRDASINDYEIRESERRYRS